MSLLGPAYSDRSYKAEAVWRQILSQVEVLRLLLVLRVALELSVLNGPFLGEIRAQGEGLGSLLAASFRTFRVKSNVFFVCLFLTYLFIFG